MSIKIIIRVYMGLFIGLFLLCGTLAFAGIENSFHNFNLIPAFPQAPGGEICIFCHTPHNAGSALVPLWNHQTTEAVFELYSSPTMDAGDISQPSGPSLACLSCHDGTIGWDSYGGVTGIGPTWFAHARFLIGTSLENDHPVGFTYDSALAQTDGKLRDPSTTASGLGGTIDEDMLRNGKMECVSCHDPHIGMEERRFFLRKSNEGSGLCFTCHDK